MSGELVGTRRFAKALYRRGLALEGLRQSQNALEAMLTAQKQLPHDVQASTTASAPLTQHPLTQRFLLNVTTRSLHLYQSMFRLFMSSPAVLLTNLHCKYRFGTLWGA